jgi:hypothetical protein
MSILLVVARALPTPRYPRVGPSNGRVPAQKRCNSRVRDLMMMDADLERIHGHLDNLALLFSFPPFSRSRSAARAGGERLG